MSPEQHAMPDEARGSPSDSLAFCNAVLHDLILTKEFNVVDPDRILIMGKRAWHAFIRLVKSSKELEITCEDKMKLDYKLMNSDKEIPVSYMPHISNNNLQSG